MESLVFRILTPDDIDGIVPIAVEAFPDDYRRGGNDNDALAFARDWVSARMRLFPYGLYVGGVSSTGRVVAYNSWIVVGGTSGVVQSDQTAVLRKERGKGIGVCLKLESERLLSNHVSEECGIELSALTCTCRADNRAMRNVLEACSYSFRSSLGQLFFSTEEVFYSKIALVPTP